MSVSIADIMKLPSLRNAKVIAGHRGLRKIISSITVLETSDIDVPSNSTHLSDELLITGFLSSYKDYDEQFRIVKALVDGGDPGLIIYYLGVFVKKLDPRIIRYANEHDFVIICMPENQPLLRYSSAINDVMTAIVKDRLSGGSIAVSLIEQISTMSPEQQSVETMLRLLSERLSASIILTDSNLRALGEAPWPQDAERISESLKNTVLSESVSGSVSLPRLKSGLIYRRSIHGASGAKLEMFAVTLGNALTDRELDQAAECVQLALNLWGQHHGTAVISELISAIIMNEPVKMRSLAEMFNIDVMSVHRLWIFSGAEFTRDMPPRISEAAARYCKTAFADIFEGSLVLFSSDIPDNEAFEKLLDEMFSVIPEEAVATVFNNEKTTSDVRRDYLMNKNFLDDARKIIPGRRVLFGGDIEFAETCRKKIDRGEESIDDALAILSSLDNKRDGELLKNTLAVYLLDADQNIQRTAELMFVHKNTVKYRLKLMSECFGFPVGTMPASYHVYKAVALRRIIPYSG